MHAPARESFESAQLGDQRLTNRLVTIYNRLSDRPNVSIPAAMKGRAEIEAAYRFFDNPRVTPEAIAGPHVSATHERIRQSSVVLLVQDTTEIDLTRPVQQVDGAGPLDGNARVGALYHPLMAFNDQGLALGTVWSKTWVREQAEQTEQKPTPAEKREIIRKLPIEEKESVRWVEGLRAALVTAKRCPQTQCICIADSEADIYEVFLEPRRVNDHRDLEILVRTDDQRSLNEGGSVVEAVRATPRLYTRYVDVSRRLLKIKAKKGRRNQPRDARLAEVEVRASTVTLRPSNRPGPTRPPVTLNVVLVEEINTPEGEIPLQWLLLTSLPIDTPEQVELIVSYYTTRWQIEVYFKTLKSGCRVEERYFERIQRWFNCLAVYAISAWETLYLCRLSRECPDLSCEVVFEPSEWKSVYMATRGNEPPKTPPSLNEIVRLIASLGGYVIRTKTQPGTQTLWIGLQRLRDLSTAWNTFGPGRTRC
jgi:hypothetical protein